MAGAGFAYPLRLISSSASLSLFAPCGVDYGSVLLRESLCSAGELDGCHSETQAKHQGKLVVRAHKYPILNPKFQETNDE